MATTAELTFDDLDTEATILEGQAKRVRQAVLKGSMLLLGGKACFYLYRARRRTARLRATLSSLQVVTIQDRQLLRAGAVRLASAAEALNAAHEQLEQAKAHQEIPLFGARMMRYLDDVACGIEDIAETAALGASQDFADAIRVEVAKLDTLNSHQAHA